ncbi:MAG: bifunctional (p)ppGpp synthetase/guanosine-3',5'-bis(diphosphate) 3'-pyrophosphohydrolase, partial [Ktedonobacteraceae bacterium]|nr:bifunctional (p)ppGpp synthetase/guanosine-3',5'-bis(diphosphate) 3'-pyrophosphohydrolase [Ktedonobacteraceae bacterium]
LREWQRSLPQGADEFVEAVKDDIFQEQIFVFTPQGEVKDLPRGSTPLDMAYRIHTDIGDHCDGARIITNTDDSGRLVTRLVPLDYELKGGEIVEIMVNRTVHPTRDWLSFARTAAARNKIRRYLKTYEREINLQLGRERLDFALKASGMPGTNEQVEELLSRICVQEPLADTTLKKFATLDDVYIALGREDLQVEQILDQLLPLLPGSEQNGASVNGKNNSYYQPREGENGSLIHLAQCCYPLLGDPIIGLPTPDKGMVVHRCECQMLRRNRENANTLLEVHWQQIHPENYLVPITLIAHDRSGLLRDVAAIVADAGINMVSVNSMSRASLKKAEITATLEIAADVHALDKIENIMRRLRQVKTVVSVERALAK